MSAVRVGLAGLGRIGRNLFRILYKNDDVQIVAIDDLADHEALEYLIKFDTLFGPFPDEVGLKDGHLYAYGRQIPMLAGDPDWAEHEVDIVVEATGRPRTRAEMETHLERGARRVVLCVPPLDPPDRTVVMGINQENLTAADRIVSNGPCTAHAAAPVVKLLDEAFGIQRAFMTTVHAYSNEQRLADVPAADPRRGRAAAENIIPQESNAAQVILGLFPHLEGRLSSEAMNVPVANGSVVDLVCWHDRPVTVAAINEVVRTATSRWPGILHFEDDPIVSSDIIRSSFSSTFDSQATMVLGDKVSKTLSWFDNGWGYAHRVVDLIRHMAALDDGGESS
ncbi:MAG: type I glyceraldehyde-3-phosphate dehydrogenase [Thermoanaerobaculia bacterium]